jgi:hypothetical protein
MMFSDSLNIVHTVDENCIGWCVHVLSVMKAYEAFLQCIDTFEHRSDRTSLCAFQKFMQTQFRSTEPCVLLRSWGSKSTYSVLCDPSDEMEHAVSRHSTCVVQQVQPRKCYIFCSNVKCRKTKNKKIVLLENKNKASPCCHIRMLLPFVHAESPDVEIVDEDSSDDEVECKA